MSALHHDALSARLDRLERSNTRWRAAAILSAGLLAAATLAGFSRPDAGPQDLRVASLSLIASDGSQAATLAFEQGLPVFRLNAQGRHAALTLADGNAGLAAGGPTGVVFAGASDTGASFSARGSDLRTGVFIGVDSALNASVRAYPASLSVAASLDVAPDGTPSFRLLAPDGTQTTLPSR